MNFKEYQTESRKTDQRPKVKTELQLVIPLLGLIGEIGSAASEHKKRIRDGKSYTSFNPKLEEELGDILWYVSNLATDMKLDLNAIAEKNVKKTQERWLGMKNFKANERFFDSAFPKGQQLPREITIEFKKDKTGKMGMFIGKKQLGDGLTDNAYENDGYRYHDIFHLAFAAVLGWSPVIRKLLGKKRRKDRVIDEVEDGARACIIEEAISAFVYSFAKEHNYFKNIERIDYEMLKTIKAMVSHLEVKNVSSIDWETAILDGYEVYRQLKAAKGGKVYLNLKKQSIKFLG